MGGEDGELQVIPTQFSLKHIHFPTKTLNILFSLREPHVHNTECSDSVQF